MKYGVEVLKGPLKECLIDRIPFSNRHEDPVLYGKGTQVAHPVTQTTTAWRERSAPSCCMRKFPKTTALMNSHLGSSQPVLKQV